MDILEDEIFHWEASFLEFPVNFPAAPLGLLRSLGLLSGTAALGLGFGSNSGWRPRTKIPEGLGFGVISPGVPEYHVQSTVASWWDYPSCERTSSGKA